MTDFDALAETALEAMNQRALELNLKGVAAVAAAEGDLVRSWSSRMLVVGTHKREPSENHPGTNFIAAAYSKLAEMADTVQHSGGPADEDVKVAQVGLDVLAGGV